MDVKFSLAILNVEGKKRRIINEVLVMLAVALGICATTILSLINAAHHFDYHAQAANMPAKRASKDR